MSPKIIPESLPDQTVVTPEGQIVRPLDDSDIYELDDDGEQLEDSDEKEDDDDRAGML
jgi:hypothetical protein